MSCNCTNPAVPPDDSPQVVSPSTGATCGTGMTLAEYNLWLQGVTPECQICSPTLNAACSDPNILSVNPATGKDLDTSWANGVQADSATLLARFGTKLAKIRGTGWLWIEKGVAYPRSLVLSVSKLWSSWVRPTASSLPVPGDPAPIEFLTAADGDGNVYAMPGMRDVDSVPVYNHTTRKWEVKATTNFPLCKEGPVEDANELELVGFTKQNPENADYLTETRCLKKLCGVGLVVLEEQLAPGDCDTDCDPPAECATTTAHTIDFPPEDGKTYGFRYTVADGLTWKEIAALQGAAGKDGADGLDGRDGRDGMDGGGNGNTGTLNINYASLAAVLDYSKLPAGPAGKDGKDGISIQGPIGPPGKDGVDGAEGKIGADGAAGQAGSSGGSIGSSVSNSEIKEIAAKITIQVQKQEFLAVPILVNSATKDTLTASQTNLLNYLVSLGGSVPDPTGTDLFNVDGVILRIDVLSTDPRDVNSAASGEHSINVGVNAREVVFLQETDAAANAADAGAILPCYPQLSTSTHCIVPWNAGGQLSVVRTSVKWATLPASSQITKYNVGYNTVKVYVMGFLVTRKLNPVYTP